MNSNETAQLEQTIEMFEIIAQGQPRDDQSLQILREAYQKLGRSGDAAATSKRLAHAHRQNGCLSAAILEFENILRQDPGDSEAREALKAIEGISGMYFNSPGKTGTNRVMDPASLSQLGPADSSADTPPGGFDRGAGKEPLRQALVEAQLLTGTAFETAWAVHATSASSTAVTIPFIQVLAEQGVLAMERSLKRLSDVTGLLFVALEQYEIDLELSRRFPAALLRRGCVLPFGRLGRSVLVATANPFDEQTQGQLQAAIAGPFISYLAAPTRLSEALIKIVA